MICKKTTKLITNMYNIDKTDYLIIKLLKQNARMPASEIARAIGATSERAVRYRIDRLIENGVINVTAVVDPKSLGLNVVADVVLHTNSDSILDIAKKIAEYEFVSYVACNIGEADVSVQILAKDTAEVYRIVTEIVGKIPGVQKTNTSIVPLVVKDIFQWDIPAGFVKTKSE